MDIVSLKRSSRLLKSEISRRSLRQDPVLLYSEKLSSSKAPTDIDSATLGVELGTMVGDDVGFFVGG